MFRFTIFLVACFLSASLSAQSFTVTDIRVEGLQRVSAGSVFTALPIRIGDQVGQVEIQKSTRELFKVGFFSDVDMAVEDGSILIVTVKERPAINEIVIDGNKAIKTDQLLDGLDGNGLSEGRIFKRMTLDGISKSLESQYVAQGRYNAKVETIVEDLPRNQVKLSIEIDEGSMAKIKHINVIGNTAFTDDELLDSFELRTTGWLSWMSGNDRYSKEKLTGDIERLESHYLDRGYLAFSLDSTQVTVSPDMASVYITLSISEGDVYKVSEVDLAGDPVIDENLIRRLVLLREGQTFSQALMTTTEDYMTKRLGNEGYTFAEVEGIPERNDEDQTVKVTFFIDPGKRAYVRRINFRGNTRTQDEVLRRELRQMEGGSASSSKIEFSKVRLQRLGFFKTVEVETQEVPGSSDLIDIEYAVEEQPSGSMSFQVGYAQSAGLVIGANVQQNNWMGTGDQVGFSVNTSKYQTVYSFNYNDPYFTEDGVNRGFDVFWQERDFSAVGVSSYATDTFGANVRFGYPISETSRLGFGIGYRNLSLETGLYASQEIVTSPEPIGGVDQYIFQSEYACINSVGTVCEDGYSYIPVGVDIDDDVYRDNTPGFINANGDEFDDGVLNMNWAQSTLNRGILATRGASQRVSLEATIPGGDLAYYKLQYNAQYYQPLTRHFTLRLRTDLGYAGAYGDTTELPFFEHFYAGGFGSVRGFERNTLGPRETPAEGYITEYATWVDANNDGVRDASELSDLSYVLCEGGQFNNVICNPGQLGSVQRSAFTEDDPFGGNVLVEGSMEILFPLPWIKDQSMLQTSLFVDAGNVFDTNCNPLQKNCYDVDLKKLSSSVGLGLTWISGFGPLTFSVAKVLSKNEYDKTEVFQFSMGNAF